MNNANAVPLEDLPLLNWWQRYWTKARLRRYPVFVRTCRLIAQDATVLFRVTYLAPRSDFSESERKAERTVGELIQSSALGTTKINEAQWRRGRLVTHQTLSTENEDVLRAIYSLRVRRHPELVVYERLEHFESKTPPVALGTSVRPVDSQVA